MIYYCNFPNCNFKTEYRYRIDCHHINPKSNDGSNKDYNLIFLCPNHHRMIYVPDITIGNHSHRYSDCLIIIGV
jgi:predicted restriction endonuclease